jgi:Na+-driven multidrug efflux pump
VGGIIAMFGFLNSSMSSATSRFLTFELGQRNYEKLNKTFSAALTVHCIIAFIIFILAETVGLCF